MQYRTEFEIGDIVDTKRFVFRITDIKITEDLTVMYTGENVKVWIDEDKLIRAI